MVEWRHRLNGHEFEQTPGDGEGQESLACFPWGCKELDTAQQLHNNNDSKVSIMCLAGQVKTPAFKQILC